MAKYQKMLLPEKMAENITDLIAKGYYKPGDKLPNEIEMSNELNISRATLREAFKILESRNVIEVRRGIGTFISLMPGLSKDPMGKQFIPFAQNEMDYIHQLQQIGVVVFEKFSYFEKSQWERIVMALPEEHLPIKVCYNNTFEMLRRIATLSESEFLNRLLVLLLQLYPEAIEKAKAPEDVVNNYYRTLIESLNNNDRASLLAAYKGLIDSLKEKE